MPYSDIIIDNTCMAVNYNNADVGLQMKEGLFPMRQIYHNSGFGLIQIVIVIAGLALIGVGGFLYYQSTYNASDSNLSAQQKAEAVSTCELEGEGARLCQALENIESASLGPVTYTLTMHATDGVASTMVVKKDGDNYHAVMRNGPDTDESIRVDKINYHTYDGVWYFQKDEPGQDHGRHHTNYASSDYMSELMLDLSGVGAVYEHVRQEPCGAVVCEKYEVKSQANPDLIDYLWIDSNVNRLMKYESKPTTGAITRIVYSYGSVDIKAPANARDYAELL